MSSTTTGPAKPGPPSQTCGSSPDSTPATPTLSNLIGELSLGSPEFAKLWAAHTVGDCGTNTRVYRHPVVGTMELAAELMALTEDDGQRVAVFTAEPASPSEAALQLLAGVTPPDGGAS